MMVRSGKIRLTTQIGETRILNDLTHLFNHGLYGIMLHLFDFELFKKVLLVALGIWLSIRYLMSHNLFVFII